MVYSLKRSQHLLLCVTFLCRFSLRGRSDSMIWPCRRESAKNSKLCISVSSSLRYFFPFSRLEEEMLQMSSSRFILLHLCVCCSDWPDSGVLFQSLVGFNQLNKQYSVKVSDRSAALSFFCSQRVWFSWNPLKILWTSAFCSIICLFLGNVFVSNHSGIKKPPKLEEWFSVELTRNGTTWK